MMNITSSQVTLQLASLFDPHAPASLRCFPVIAGSDTGKFLTNDANNPRWGAVWEPGDGGLYLAGALEAATIQYVVATLRHEGDVVVQWRAFSVAGRQPGSTRTRKGAIRWKLSGRR